MEQGHIREFPWQRQVRRDYKGYNSRSADGSPPDGLYVESKGFDTFLYRTEPLTVINEFDEVQNSLPVGVRSRKPHAFRFSDLDLHPLPRTILKSSDMNMSVLNTNAYTDSFGLRNGDGNEVFFVHDGQGQIYTDFGLLDYMCGDYIFIPSGTTYFINPDVKSMFVIAEISKQVFLARHPWLSDFFPFSPSSLVPAMPIDLLMFGIGESSQEKFRSVFVKTDGVYRTKIVYPFSPFNCVEWQGKMYPFKLAMEHIHTIVSPTFHMPPTALITFTTEDLGAMISTFKSRWIHSLPYNHINEHEEFLFYHDGDYGARTNIKLGDATLHPVGVHHGPQPNRLKEWNRVEPKDLPWREETAIMFESRSPFSVYPEGEKIKIKGYETSWSDEWEEGQ